MSPTLQSPNSCFTSPSPQPLAPSPYLSLAFVDLETTGLSAAHSRITEIGVVTVDESGVHEWTTLINPGRRISQHTRLFNGIANEHLADAPRFTDIAADLAQRLQGRLFIAHNARFDFGFLRSEFARVGIEFQPQVLCSVMLSRRLYPQHARHDLDTLMERHGLTAEVRHRALPDARLIWQFWQVIQGEQRCERVAHIIEDLLAGPVLPAELDPSLVERLPEAPGVYTMLDADGRILRVGKAGNLKLHVQHYFRVDRMSKKAWEISITVRNIIWQVTSGTIGTHLRLQALCQPYLTPPKQCSAEEPLCWQWQPHAAPCVRLVPFSYNPAGEERYGLFASERRARNALSRLAAEHGLCHALLGIDASVSIGSCAGCALDGATHCGRKSSTLKHLTRIWSALRTLRLPVWPHAGPVAIKERSELHVISHWQYLGSARNEEELYSVLETRPVFDEKTFRFLAKTLARLPARRLVRL